MTLIYLEKERGDRQTESELVLSAKDYRWLYLTVLDSSSLRCHLGVPSKAGRWAQDKRSKGRARVPAKNSRWAQD